MDKVIFSDNEITGIGAHDIIIHAFNPTSVRNITSIEQYAAIRQKALVDIAKIQAGLHQVDYSDLGSLGLSVLDTTFQANENRRESGSE